MPKTAAKVAISLPYDLYRKVERARKKQRRTRSAVVQDLLRSWLRKEEEAEKDRQYIEAYRRMPETAEEIAEAEAMAKDSWPEWEWS
jgi:metal-responsive CopG/Arc/MetJ family transcriptional regulator